MKASVSAQNILNCMEQELVYSKTDYSNGRLSGMRSAIAAIEGIETEAYDKASEIIDRFHAKEA